MTYLLLALFISLAIQAIVIYISHKKDILIDKGDEDKPQRFHDTHTPRAGGIGIFTANLLLFFTPLGWKFILAGIFAFLSGLLEDISGNLSPKVRLILQTLSALIGAFLLGAVLQHTETFSLPYPIAVLFAVFAVVGMTNAINIIDGFNGLAGGVSLMILLSFLGVAIDVGDSFLVDILLINIGALIGFLLFNYPKGKIFMGDGGAYFIGFIIAESAILLYERNYQLISSFYILATLIYPVWEVLFSIYRRVVINKTSPFHPDKAHLHTLINRRITKSNHKTSLFIWIANIPFLLIAISFYNSKFILIGVCALFATLYVIAYINLGKRRKRV